MILFPVAAVFSALNGALATSLAAMVANLTIGRKKYVEVNEIMEDLFCSFRRTHPPADNRCRP